MPVEPSAVEAAPELACPDCRVAQAGFVLDLARPDHAYFFGFAQADGHLSADSRSRGVLAITLRASDAGLLAAFRDLMPFNSNLSFRERTTNFGFLRSATWAIHHRRFREALTRAGFPIGRKSEIVRPPQEPFARDDYFRGWVDGDGSLGFTKAGLPFISLVTSSDAIAKAFKAYVFNVTGQRLGTGRNKRDGVYNLMVLKEEAQRLAGVMYSGAHLTLARKAVKAEEITAWVRPSSMKRKRQRRWTPEEDAIVALRTPIEAAAALRRTIASVSVRRQRLRKLGVQVVALQRRVARARRLWKVEEDAILLRLSPESASQFLDRSMAALYARRMVLRKWGRLARPRRLS